jgi:(p)ppGpp synthase/HD superfamily hydrolase
MVNQLLGASAECALIDGQEVDLDREIPNACICEIIPGPPRRAPEVTNEQYQLLLPSTKAAIDKQRRLSKRDELAIEGRQMIADLLAKNGLLSLEDLGDKIRQILYGNNCSSMEEAYARIAQGNLTLATISDWVEKQSQAFKAERQCTTILVSDHDRPGVISEISSLVLQFGGNISDMGLSFNSDHTTFRMRLVVNNLDPSKERRIRAIIMNENRYQFGVVI